MPTVFLILTLLSITGDANCCHAGLELLPGGTFVTTTYGHWVEGEQPFIMSVRFTMKELDVRAKRPLTGTGGPDHPLRLTSPGGKGG